MPHRFEQLRNAGARGPRDAEERQFQLPRPALERLDARRVVDGVHLVGGDELRLGRQRRLKQLQLSTDRVKILDRVAQAAARYVDDVYEHSRPFEVPQELMAETETAVRPLDQAGHVGNDEAAIA